MSEFLLYGANGYTGRLIAKQAVAQGLRPTLAGRDGEAVGAMAAKLDLPHRVFGLDDRQALDAALAEAPLVLHCAGPFVHTSRPVADACLRTGTHYLDITGEIEVFEALAARTEEAEAAGTMLLPGVGFDVVPSDCLAAHLENRLPSATRLALAFQGLGGVSRGTALTAVENLGRPGVIRRKGKLQPVPAAWKTRTVNFGAGGVRVTSIPWGDVSTAFHSTGIEDIEVYTRLGRTAHRALSLSRRFGGVLGSSPVKGLLRVAIRRGSPGPDAEQRARGATHFWGEVEDNFGRRAISRLHGPEGYTLTALAAVASVQKVLAGAARPGFQTPSLAFGADFVLEIPGVKREDVV